MTTRPLNAEELAILAAGEGIPCDHPMHDRITCAGDNGYGPCGTYRDWAEGRCAEGHRIEIEQDDD